MRTTKSVTRQKATGSHFTPPALARFVARRILRALGTPPGPIRVLDPACGDGELLAAFAAEADTQTLAQATLIGVESDCASLSKAARRLQDVPRGQLILEPGDFLEMCRSKVHGQRSLFDTDHVHHLPGNGVSVIIANPPYVRTQVLGAQKARELAQVFGLSGRVDMYQAFLAGMTSCLRPRGVLGAIIPNRFLTTRAGACTRELLACEYRIHELFDLGDTKLFGAAVLPAVVIADRRGGSDVSPTIEGTRPRFGRAYEALGDNISPGDEPEDADSVLDVLDAGRSGLFRVGGRVFRLASGEVTVEPSPLEPWRVVTDSEREWLRIVEANAGCRVMDVGSVRVGIKTTADQVFIRRDWATLPEATRPEAGLLRPLLSHDDAARWVARRPVEGLRRVLYTHESRDGRREAIRLEHYPGAAAYLQTHRVRLAARKYVADSGRKWYEIWVPQDPDGWSRTKVVFPDISPLPRFFLDREGCVVDGNCYWIGADARQSEDILYLILGVANSALMTRYHDLAFANRLYSGRRRYLTQYVERYPLPDPDTRAARGVIELCKDLVQMGAAASSRAAAEEEVERAVCGAFGVPPVG